ncbi:MAG: 50S ribosomal protein L16 [Nanoarchaeota archaeon]
MALRKAAAYSKRYARPYTRKSKKKGKNYVKMYPPSKIVKFDMGDVSGFNQGKFPILVRLVAGHDVQIRDTALEAGRQVIIKAMESNFGVSGFAAFLKVHPHHVLREHKMLTGAGADRMSSGMSLSFGVSVGRAAMVKGGSDIFVVATNSEKGKKICREAYMKIRPKIPGSCVILVDEPPVKKATEIEA